MVIRLLTRDRGSPIWDRLGGLDFTSPRSMWKGVRGYARALRQKREVALELPDGRLYSVTDRGFITV